MIIKIGGMIYHLKYMYRKIRKIENYTLRIQFKELYKGEMEQSKDR